MKYSFHKLQNISGNFAIINTAWRSLKADFLKILTAVLLLPLLAGLLSVICSIVCIPLQLVSSDGILPVVIPSVICGLIAMVLSAYSNVGLPFWMSNLVSGSPKSYSDAVKTGVAEYPRYLIAALVAGVIIILKLFLLIVPGIMAMLDYAMLPYVISRDKDLGPCEALKRSRAIMYGHRWQFLGLILLPLLPTLAFMMLSIILFISGSILLIIPLAIAVIIVIIPLSLLFAVAFAVFYGEIMPPPESDAALELPPVSGNGAFSKELNVILLIIIAIFHILSSGGDLIKESEKLSAATAEEVPTDNSSAAGK